MLISIKLNAVQVIKFTGEYNYIVKEGYLNKSNVKLSHRNKYYLSKNHTISHFSAKSRKIMAICILVSFHKVLNNLTRLWWILGKMKQKYNWKKFICVVLWYLCNSGILSVHYRLLTMTHQSKTKHLNWYVMCYLEYGKKYSLMPPGVLPVSAKAPPAATFPGGPGGPGGPGYPEVYKKSMVLCSNRIMYIQNILLLLYFGINYCFDEI